VGLKLNLKLVKGPIHSLEKAKSKIPVNQSIGGIAAGTAFTGVLAESSSLLNDSPVDGRYQVYAILDPKSGLL